jgi:autotransporter-associated beta strand protein
LSGVNSFTGATTINAGTLRTVGGSALADTSAVTIAGGAALDLNGASEAIGSLAGSGNVALGSAVLTVGANNSSTTYAGAISGSGGLSKAGAGTFTLTGANNYTGPTDVIAGTLVLQSGLGTPGGALSIGASGALQARNVVNRAITGAGTITATGTLFLGDPNSVSGVAFAGTLVLGSNVVFLADADAAELGAATTLGAGGRLDSLNGAVLGSGESATVGAAVSASISGSFTNNGTVNGPTSAGQALTFSDDVNGTGSYTGRVTFSDGFSPGASAAAVPLENFTFDISTTLNIELGGVNVGSQFDQLNFTGTGVLDGTLIVSLINGFNPQPGNAFSFIQGGTLSGAFDAVNLPPLDPGLSWSYSQTANAAMLAVVPEPTVASWLAAGALVMARVRKPRVAR